MNFLFIGTTDALGGAAKISWDLKNALKEQGHATSMFVADKRSQDASVKIIPRQKWRKYLGFLLATDDLLSSDWILKTPEYKNADIVHCHNLHGRYFNLSTLQEMSIEKPVIWTLHDEWAITPHCVCTFEGKEMKNGLFICQDKNTPPRILWDNTKYLLWRKNSIYKKSRLHIVTPSQWLMERVEKTILNLQDVRLIHNGIDADAFKMSDKNIARQKLGLPSDKKIILFLADDAKNNIWKGWNYVEEVIGKYKDNKNLFFIIAGNYAYHPDEDNVKHILHMNKKEDVALYYSAADIFLFTSVAENFPLVILEAMSCGLPIVSFDVGGVKEAVIHKENGYISTYKDTRSLIEGIEYILNLNANELEAMSKSSIKRIQDYFTSTIMINNYLNLYLELLRQ
ncbi:MAG: Glycosyl transferase group 1 [Microgenomates group bacterium GW2011_GWA2_44_7]|nr:MAG: Glycosyl transferase group 1 [Microgenomates group bacterium GW2011_GWA2_44_7]